MNILVVGDSYMAPSYFRSAFEQVEKAAAQDVAAVEEDAKYFGSDSPASQDEL